MSKNSNSNRRMWDFSNEVEASRSVEEGDIFEDAPRVSSQFGWLKSYKKEVRGVLGEIVDTVRQSDLGDGKPLEVRSFSEREQERISTFSKQEPTSPLPVPGNTLQNLMREVASERDRIQVESLVENCITSIGQPSSEPEVEEIVLVEEPVVEEVEENVPKVEEKPVVESRQTGKTRKTYGNFVVLGVSLGLVFLLTGTVLLSRLDQRFLNRLGNRFDQVSCGDTERGFLGTSFRFHDVELLHSQEPENRQNLLIDNLSVEVSPSSFVGRGLNVQEVQMDGVRFPLLSANVSMGKNREIPEMGITEDVQKRMDTRMERLESLVYLEGVKKTYLPQYESFATRLRELGTEAEKIQAEMVTLMGTAELTQKLVDERPERMNAVRNKIERLVAIRSESENLKTQWSELNKQVAKDLSQVQEKITLDGQAFSEMLKFTVPTEEALSADLFSSDAEQKLHQSAACVDALCNMVFAAMETGSQPVPSVKTSGEIDLFGQRFSFSGNWNTETQEGCQRSFYGTLQLSSTETAGHAAMLQISCRDKANLRQKHLTASIPLVQENRMWGSPRSFALDSHSQSGTVEIDLTFYDDEVRGKMTLVRNGLTFVAPRTGIACKALEEYIEKRTLSGMDSLKFDVAVSGTRSVPRLECHSNWTAELIPVCTASMKELSRHKRNELIAKVYEKLKNAETVFNCSIDPFYQEMVASSEKVVQITEGMSKGIVFRNSEGNPYEVPPLPVTDQELSEVLAVAEEEGDLPQYDPTLGAESEISAQVGTQVETPETGFRAKFVPVKKVDLIAEMENIPALKDTKSTPVPVAVSPMDPSLFEKSTHIHHAETPMPLAAQEKVPAKTQDPMDIQLPELDENLQPISPTTESIAEPVAEPTVKPVVKPTSRNMPVPVMRSTTPFQG